MAGLALPPLAFITWPTRKPELRPLCRRGIGDHVRLLGDHLVDGGAERALVGRSA